MADTKLAPLRALLWKRSDGKDDAADAVGTPRSGGGKGGGKRKKWDKRFFAVDEEKLVMHWWKDEKSYMKEQHPMGGVSLVGASLSNFENAEAIGGVKGPDASFAVEAISRTLFLRPANSNTEVEMWMIYLDSLMGSAGVLVKAQVEESHMRFKSMILRLLYKKMAKLEIPHVNSKAVGSTLVLTDIKLSELNIPQKSLKLSGGGIPFRISVDGISAKIEGMGFTLKSPLKDDDGRINITMSDMSLMICLDSESKVNEEDTLEDYRNERFRNTFKAVDANSVSGQNGSISHKEMRVVLQQVSGGTKLDGEKFAAAISEMDADGSGEINEEEFVAWARDHEKRMQALGDVEAEEEYDDSVIVPEGGMPEPEPEGEDGEVEKEPETVSAQLNPDVLGKILEDGNSFASMDLFVKEVQVVIGKFKIELVDASAFKQKVVDKLSDRIRDLVDQKMEQALHIQTQQLLDVITS